MLGLPALSAYVLQPFEVDFPWPYMLVDFVARETGVMLSNSWKDGRNDLEKTNNLMRGLSQIMLSLARVPLPRIGALRFNDNGSVSLENRPIFAANLVLEEQGAPALPDRTYSSSAAFLSALLDFRQQAFQLQPNAATSDDDCHLQMAHFVILRATMSALSELHYEGPFVMQHTDLHASNILVDSDWNVTAVIDLESICSLPPEMIGFPYWLAADYVDELAENMEKVNQVSSSFDRIMEEKQAELGPSPVDLTAWMRKAWKSGAYYLWLPFDSVNAFPAMVEDHILPMFGVVGLSREQEKDMHKTLSQLWSRQSAAFIETKAADKRQYDTDLADFFTTHFGKESM